MIYKNCVNCINSYLYKEKNVLNNIKQIYFYTNKYFNTNKYFIQNTWRQIFSFRTLTPRAWFFLMVSCKSATYIVNNVGLSGHPVLPLLLSRIWMTFLRLLLLYFLFLCKFLRFSFSSVYLFPFSSLSSEVLLYPRCQMQRLGPRKTYTASHLICCRPTAPESCLRFWYYVVLFQFLF